MRNRKRSSCDSGSGKVPIKWCGFWAAMEHETLGVRLIDRHPEDIRWQQVAGELDAFELQSQGLRQHLRQRGLAHPRQVFDQQVSARKQAGERKARLTLLAEHYLANALDDGIEHASGRRMLSFRC